MAVARRVGWPALSPAAFGPLPSIRPTGLDLVVGHWVLHRVDSTPFTEWSWQAFSSPRFRFDPASSSCRVRYGSTSEPGAVREVYRDSGLYVPSTDASKHWCDVAGDLAVLDLRDEAVLDLLRVDARASTSYEPHVARWCHELTDRVQQWWGPDVHGIAYTSRTTPATSANLAFFPSAPLSGTSAPLVERPDVLTRLILTGGLQVGFDF